MKVHKQNLSYRYMPIPACLSFYGWDRNRRSFQITRYNKKVTCKKCLKIMENK